MVRPVEKQGKAVCVVLAYTTLDILDELAGKLHLSRSRMIDKLASDAAEIAGITINDINDIAKEEQEIIKRLKEIQEKKQRIETQKPLLEAREAQKNSQHTEFVNRLVRKIMMIGKPTSDFCPDIVTVEEVNVLAVNLSRLLDHEWSADELLNEAYGIVNKT